MERVSQFESESRTSHPLIQFREEPLRFRHSRWADGCFQFASSTVSICRAFGATVVGDEAVDHAGPLAGIAAALAVTTTPWLACVPCDAPFLPADLVARLGAARTADGGGAQVRHQGAVSLIERETVQVDAAVDRHFAALETLGGAPVHVGDRITCQQKVIDIYDKKGGALWFVVSETEMKDQSGKPVARARGITVVRNPDAGKK